MEPTNPVEAAEMEQIVTTTTTKISFGLAAQKKKTVQKSTVMRSKSDDEDEEEVEVKRRKLTHFEDGVMVEDETERNKKQKKTFVIPKVVTCDWRVDKLKKMVEEGTATDEDRARLALMLEARGDATSEEPAATGNEGGSQVLAPSADPAGDDEDPDYEKIPLHEFGAAFLRGYGWKQDEGIGKTNRRVVPLQVTKARPKGLGLGAEQALKLDEKKAQGTDDEPTEILPGSFVKIVSGAHKDRYGHVKSMDVDNSSCYVKLAIGAAEPIRVSQFILVRVSKKEYDKHGKVLNQKEYEEVRRKIETAARLEEDIKPDKSRIKREKYDDNAQKWDDRRHDAGSPREKRPRMWVMPNLRVRFVDEKYKRGEYFKKKMVVVEAADRDNCELRDDSGRMHYNIKQKWLETVIPREKDARVMIVDGKHRGLVGAIAERDDRKYYLWVRLIHTDEIVKISFDEACEWTVRDE
jgi:G patch domain/KOW motif-containing protein